MQVKSIRAPAYTGGVTGPARRALIAFSRGTSEPPSVALLRHILNPTVIVGTPLLTALAYGLPLSQHYLALAALAFLISAQVVSDPCSTARASRPVDAADSPYLQRVAARVGGATAARVRVEGHRGVLASGDPYLVRDYALCCSRGTGRLPSLRCFSALRGKILQSHVIVGANEVGARLARRLRANPHLGTFRGFFDDRHSERLPGLSDEQLLGGTTDIADYVRSTA